jgi:hypothetical protein
MAGNPCGQPMQMHTISTTATLAHRSGRIRAYLKLPQQIMDRTTGLLTTYHFYICLLFLTRTPCRFANSSTAVVTTSSGAPGTSSPPKRSYGGYNPKIHGNYDPNADYAKEAEREEEEQEAAASAAAAAALAAASGVPKSNAQDYATTAHFNRFTGRYQQADKAEYHNDENKSKRQMNAFFDVDAAANSHDGRSLKAERRGKQLSKQEIKAFQTKRRERKDEKRRNWLTKD